MKTISEEYRQVLKQTHKESPFKWGQTGMRLWVPYFTEVMKEKKLTKVLDYGAGWGGVKDTLSKSHPDIEVLEYEPSRPDVAASPEPCEFVICHDVLEHIEPEYLDNVIMDLKRVTKGWGHFSVCTRPAIKILSDGRNAHLIVEDFEWWLMKLAPHFHIRNARFISNKHVSGDLLVERKVSVQSTVLPGKTPI
jgi:hypothetical protein